ncbi:MAG: histidinol-phosphatase HisJ family protein [Heliobacteriaceae bacterium]|nr:histidinol-phosphatase HisJ family protein [Heliobacteriaceae bacterium]MDD4588032.1 histidinol-phosphatase HisJ family protein [Heliobacteriaceae bacterium]
MLVDYHVHAMGHGTSRHTPEEIALYLATAAGRGIAQVGFADHDWYLADYDLTAIKAAAGRFPGVQVRLGVEVDFLLNAGERLQALVSRYPFDFVIGSVHQLGEWGFDCVEDVERYQEWDPDVLYREYFRHVAAAAQSGLFSFIGHLDLIKIFNVRSRQPVAELAAEALAAIRQAGLPCEINTNGLNKPVKEIYPQRSLLERCFALGIPVTLGSDAHFAAEVGRDLALARELAWSVGYRKIATFFQRRCIMENL